MALLADFDVEGTSSVQWFVHRDGQQFTPEEADLIGSATGADMRAAAPERLAGVLVPYLREAAEGMSNGDPPGHCEQSGAGAAPLPS